MKILLNEVAKLIADKWGQEKCVIFSFILNYFGWSAGKVPSRIDVKPHHKENTHLLLKRIKWFFFVPGDLVLYERALPLSRTQQFALSGSNHFSIIRVFVRFDFFQ